MPLNDMSLEELLELSRDLRLLEEVGCAFLEAGMVTTFDLTPGARTKILLPGIMPSSATPSTAATPAPDGAEASSPPVPVDQPPAVEGPAGGDPFPSAPEQSAAGEPETTPPAASPQNDPEPVAREAEESGGGQSNGSGSTPHAAPVPGSASALASAAQDRTRWTEEEDDRLVAFIVDQVTTKGLTKSAALPLAAAELGRPEPGTEFRANRKLKDRINAAIQAAAMRQAQTETPETPSPEAARQDAPPPQAEVQGDSAVPQVRDAPASEPEAGAGASFGAVPDLHGQDLTLWHFLQDYRPKWPLTWATDLDLVEALARGEKLPVISADLGIDAGLLKNRFHILTNRILDARGNPTIDGQRRLIEVLRRIVASAAKAA